MNTNSEYQLLKYALNVRHWYQRCWMGVCVCVCVRAWMAETNCDRCPVCVLGVGLSCWLGFVNHSS